MPEKKRINNYWFANAVVFCGILLIASPAMAQYAGFKAIGDRAAFNARFSAESSKVLTVASDFRQEKTLSALSETITSNGKFWFKRSNRIRLEYVKPYPYLMIMNGDRMLVRDEAKENRINVRSNALFKQVNRIMIDCVQGTILDSKDFSVRVFESDAQYLLEMTPVSKTLKDFFATIVLRVDKKDYTVSTMTMNEPGGDHTVLSFINKKLNTPVDDAVFVL